MSKAQARGGFFDDDDDDLPESYQSTTAAVAGGDDSLDFGRDLSPLGGPAPVREDRGSSVGTGSRTAGRVSSVTGAAAGSSVRGWESSRGDSPSLEDILGEGSGRDKARNVQRLLRAWQNEMGAPELLRFPSELVEKVVKDLARRVSAALFPPLKHLLTVSLTARARSEGAVHGGPGRILLHGSEHRRSGEHAGRARPQDVHTRTDMEGVCEYVCERRHAALTLPSRQLEQCAEYYLSQPDAHERLYANEIAHAQGYVHILASPQRALTRLLRRAATSASSRHTKTRQRWTPCPSRSLDNLRRVSRQCFLLSGRWLTRWLAVPTPDFSKPVFLRARKDCPPVVLPEYVPPLLLSLTTH